ASLAFLSACRSAMGDMHQPVHIAAAMLDAGFRSIMGTMWTMADEDGPVVAKAFYRELMHSWKVGNRSSATYY
ncbi:hypothetical protein JOM56_011368, partial [Amanita muscaria]